MLVTGPFTLTAGQANPFSSPYQGTPNANRVQLQNSTVYNLVVQAAGITTPIPAYNAVTIAVDETQQISVTPSTSLVVPSPGTLELYWLQAQDESPVPDGPLTGAALVAAAAVANPNVVDFLGTITLTGVVNALTTQAIPGGALKNYAGFMLVPTAAFPSAIAATVRNTTKGLAAQPQTWQGGITNHPQTQPLYIPTPAVAGDGLAVQAAAPNNSGTTVTVNVFGLGVLPANAPNLRGDGRLPAMGANYVYNSVTGIGTVGLVSVIPSPWSLLLKSCFLQSDAGNNLAWIQATVNGVSSQIMHLIEGQGGPRDFGDGVLTDAGSPNALILESGTAGIIARAGVFFDVVY